MKRRKRRKIAPLKVLEELNNDSTVEEDTVTIAEEDTVTTVEEDTVTEQKGEIEDESNVITLEIYLGTRGIYLDNVEFPRRYGLKVFPTKIFAENMAYLDSLRNTKRVRSNFTVIF